MFSGLDNRLKDRDVNIVWLINKFSPDAQLILGGLVFDENYGSVLLVFRQNY